MTLLIAGTVRASTVERHEINIRVHIVPTLGRLKLKALTPANVRGLHREKLDAGLSSATVRKIHSTLHKALVQAVARSRALTFESAFTAALCNNIGLHRFLDT